MSASAHEVVVGFRNEGLELKPVLVEMLNEHFNHCTERRGCGYTQATRFLSKYINNVRDPVAPDDLGIFDDWPMRETEHVATDLCSVGWSRGWRALNEAPSALLESVSHTSLRNALAELPAKIGRIRDAVERVESRILMSMIEQLLLGSAPPAADVAGMPVKPDIGSCSQAEEYFLEIAHHRVRRGGAVNVIVDRDGQPLMLEKMNLGESHSAIVVAPVRINGVVIPPGGLCALKYSEAFHESRRSELGLILPLVHVAQALFLRLTTLCVPPSARKRAFSAQVESQIRSDMFSPMATTIEQLQELAREQVASAT
jgi:hypothetical protein